MFNMLYLDAFHCKKFGCILWAKSAPIQLQKALEAINQANRLEDKQEMEKILMNAWGVWALRNKKIFEQTTTHPKDILLTAWEDFQVTGAQKSKNDNNMDYTRDRNDEDQR